MIFLLFYFSVNCINPTHQFFSTDQFTVVYTFIFISYNSSHSLSFNLLSIPFQRSPNFKSSPRSLQLFFILFSWLNSFDIEPIRLRFQNRVPRSAVSRICCRSTVSGKFQSRSPADARLLLRLIWNKLALILTLITCI